MRTSASSYFFSKLICIVSICCSSAYATEVQQPSSVNASCDLNAQAAPLYQAEQRIQYRQLSNGLQVRTLAVDGSSSVSIASQFDVGSRDEVKGQTGYAHLFEHMLFKGSKNAPGDSYTQTMSELSGQFNASTFFDFTNYYLTIPAPALELSLWLEADRFRYPALTATTVKTNKLQCLRRWPPALITNLMCVKQWRSCYLKLKVRPTAMR